MNNELVIQGKQSLEEYITAAQLILENCGSVQVIGKDKKIGKAVQLVEIIKHNERGLHQINSFEHTNNIRNTQVVLTLTKEPPDPSTIGYQPPLEQQEKAEVLFQDAPKREADTSHFNSCLPPEASKYKQLPLPSLSTGPNCIVISARNKTKIYVETVLKKFNDGAETVVLRNSNCGTARVINIAKLVLEQDPSLKSDSKLGIRRTERRYLPLEEGLDEVVKVSESDDVLVTITRKLS